MKALNLLKDAICIVLRIRRPYTYTPYTVVRTSSGAEPVELRPSITVRAFTQARARHIAQSTVAELYPKADGKVVLS